MIVSVGRLASGYVGLDVHMATELSEGRPPLSSFSPSTRDGPLADAPAAVAFQIN